MHHFYVCFIIPENANESDMLTFSVISTEMTHCTQCGTEWRDPLNVTIENTRDFSTAPASTRTSVGMTGSSYAINASNSSRSMDSFCRSSWATFSTLDMLSFITFFERK